MGQGIKASRLEDETPPADVGMRCSMGKKTFSPYAKGVPEKKEFVSRYDPIRDTASAESRERKPVADSAAAARPAVRPAETGAARKTDNHSMEPVSPTAWDAGLKPSGQPSGHASTRVAGATGNRPAYTPPVDRDLLEGLEGNQRRQRGWGDDSKPNELCDGIAITPISKTELKKKLAAQKSGGFIGGKNT